MSVRTAYLLFVVSSDLDDARDIDRCRLALMRQISNVLCYFGKLIPVIKMNAYLMNE